MQGLLSIMKRVKSFFKCVKTTQDHTLRRTDSAILIKVFYTVSYDNNKSTTSCVSVRCAEQDLVSNRKEIADQLRSARKLLRSKLKI